MFFNPFTPGGDDRFFSVSAHASLMWAGVKALAELRSCSLSPNNFNATFDSGTLSRINQTTTLSMDLDRPGAAPFIFDPSTAAYTVAYNVTAPGNGTYTSTGVTAQTFPTPSLARTPRPLYHRASSTPTPGVRFWPAPCRGLT